MSIDVLIARNTRQAEALRATNRSLTPALRTIVLTCADHRVDPAHLLDLRLGEAVVLRNAGGRLTADVLRSLLVLSTVASVEGVDVAFDIVVMHHTDCGLSRLSAPEHIPLIADYIGIAEHDAASVPVAEPWKTVEHDVGRLRQLVRSSKITVTGLVYDLETGTVRPSA